MIGGLGQVTKIPELSKRVMFTIGMLAVYRLGVFVSTPGIDVEALRKMFEFGQGTLFGLINMFSGGALENFSIFTLGITPYISVSIIIQMLTPMVPSLDALRKEGEAGRRVLTRYTRQGTVVLGLVQSLLIAYSLEGQGLVLTPGWTFRISTMLTLTAGTAFIMWLGEQITERGIGNGISIVIFAGIAARMPQEMLNAFALARTGEINPLAVLFMLFFGFVIIYGIVFVERSYRKVPIQYPRRMVGKNMAQAQTQHLPLKVNMSGVIPPIFASAFMVLPTTVAALNPSEALDGVMQYLTPGSGTYELIFAALIVFFSFFYTSVVFNPQEVAENLKKNGGFIPTVRPGKQTADFLYAILNRLALWGALYLSIICILPQVVYRNMGLPGFSYIFGGTAILIVVGVTLDTYSQIQNHLVAKSYENFMNRSTKKKGGMGSMSYQRSRLLRR